MLAKGCFHCKAQFNIQINNKHSYILGLISKNKYNAQFLKRSGRLSILNHNPFISFIRFYSKNPT
jgi:hypothetical protein